ncbi:MAG: acetamidase/formamidase family protein [Chloroflexi bacterium]|nr:acetamidase/formamidase family protein [Chloroflexota bacterium]
MAGKSDYLGVDLSKPLAQQPATGHNRWHPAIPPALRVDAGDRVTLETRDAFDGQITSATTSAELPQLSLDVVHPLTGPVAVNGAEPGDLLEVHLLEIEPATFGYTAQVPGFGFLRDVFPDPFLVKWTIADGYATSPDLPGVRVPGASFPGTIGLAPSRELLQTITRREQALLEKGGAVLPPSAAGAVPADPAIAAEAIRTIAPHETAGNVDVKQLTAGTRLMLPVYEPGALFSIGDAHFAQGDSECCGTAIEMCGTFTVEFALRKGLAAQRGIKDAQFARDDYYLPPEFAAPRRFYATTGMCIRETGENLSEDATVAARNALLNMIDYLGYEYGYSRQQAYALCSVAVDLKVSELVDVPNFVVSAFLPLDVFVS